MTQQEGNSLRLGGDRAARRNERRRRNRVWETWWMSAILVAIICACIALVGAVVYGNGFMIVLLGAGIFILVGISYMLSDFKWSSPLTASTCFASAALVTWIVSMI